jgi:general secretion pathway protein D
LAEEVADFDGLINAIVTTVAPDTWDDIGGPGSIQPFAANLSLVVSQTEDVHEQIADLLEQMRRLLDVQIVVEARFLSVPQTFLLEQLLGVGMTLPEPQIRATSFVSEDGLERIGIDFDVAPIEDELGPKRYALLTDAQVKRLLEGVQADATASVMAAPKVAIFNGQRAFLALQGIDRIENHRSKSNFLSKIRKAPARMVEREMLSLGLQGVAANDLQSVRLTVAPRWNRASHPLDDEPDDDGETAPQPSSPIEPGPIVTVNVPEGRTALIDARDLPDSAFDSNTPGQRWLLLATPRIVVTSDSPQQ